MPKMKSRKSVLKRFKVSSGGKILRGQSFTSHLRVRKSSKHKRRLSGLVPVNDTYAKRLTKFMGIRKKKTFKVAVNNAK